MNKYFFILTTLLLNIVGGYLAKLSALSVTSTIQIQYTLLAITCYGLGFISYTIALRHIPLFVAQSILITQYIAIILMSFLIFRETLSYAQGLGIIFILIGLLLVTIK